MKRYSLTVVLLIILAATATLRHSSVIADIGTEEERLFQLTDQERVSRGIAALHPSALLSEVARNYSREMMEHGFFSHVSEVDGSTLWERVRRSEYYEGYHGPIVVRENIALLLGSADATSAHQGFMNSDGHRQNLLSADVNEIGIGITEGNFRSVFAAIYVEVFAYKELTTRIALAATVAPTAVRVQRGHEATLRIHVESNPPSNASIQVINAPSGLAWRIERPSGMTPLDSTLTLNTTSVMTGLYTLVVAATSDGQMKTLTVMLEIFQPTQTTTSPTATISSASENTTTVSTTPTNTTQASTTTEETQTSHTSSTTSTLSTTLQTHSTTSMTQSSTESTTIESQTSEATTTSVTTSIGVVTQTRTGITTIPLPQMRCLIATAAFGSEMSPEIHFLRLFRDTKVVTTFAGRAFLKAFDAAYYSFSPSIARFVAMHPSVASFVRVLLSPLILMLRLASLAFDRGHFNTNAEIAVVFSGLLASCLIGLVYNLPLILVMNRIRKLIRVTART